MNENDLKEIIANVRNARRLSDLLIVALHAHESGKTTEEPASFLRQFAHAAVDAGADMVVGHGPHVLGGRDLQGPADLLQSGELHLPERHD